MAVQKMTTATRNRFSRRRRTAEERAELERESLQRATSNPSWRNFGQVIEEFTARGIPASEINPKENVFTYNAWRALGRQVRKGEKSVKITTWHPIEEKERGASGGAEKATARLRAVTACVFHISQTDPIEGAAPAAAPSSAAWHAPDIDRLLGA